MDQLQDKGISLRTFTETFTETFPKINNKHLHFLRNAFCLKYEEPESVTTESWRSCLCENDVLTISPTCLSHFSNLSLHIDELYQDYNILLNWPMFPERFIIPVLFGLIFLAGLYQKTSKAIVIAIAIAIF